MLAKHLMREAGIPTPDFFAFKRERRSASSARGARSPASGAELGFPIVVKPASQGSALGVKFARTRAEFRRAIVAALLLRPQGAARALRAGRDLAVSVIDAARGDGR